MFTTLHSTIQLLELQIFTRSSTQRNIRITSFIVHLCETLGSKHHCIWIFLEIRWIRQIDFNVTVREQSVHVQWRKQWRHEVDCQKQTTMKREWTCGSSEITRSTPWEIRRWIDDGNQQTIGYHSTKGEYRVHVWQPFIHRGHSLKSRIGLVLWTFRRAGI